MRIAATVIFALAWLQASGCDSGQQDLAAYGLSATIKVPEGALLQVGEGGVQIIGPGQALSVKPSGGETSMQKWIETGVDEDDVLIKSETRPDGWLALWREQRGNAQAYDFVRYRQDLDLLCAPLTAAANQIDMQEMLATCETIRAKGGAVQ